MYTIKRSLLLGLVTYLLCGSTLAQSLWTYPPLTPDAETEALQDQVGIFVDIGRYAEARQLLRKISVAQTGNALGASALLDEVTICYLMGKPEDVAEITAQVIQQYSGSRFEFAARKEPLTRQLWGAGTAARVTGFGDFAESFGAPPIETLLAGTDIEGAAAQIAALPPELRLSLSSVYTGIVGALRQGDRPEEALNVALFGRLAFDSHPYSENTFSYGIRKSLRDITGKPNWDTVPSTPAVTIISPASGSTVGLQPTISVRVTTGNYRQAPLDLSRLSFKVDGVEKQLEVAVSSEIDRSLSESGDFEILTLTLTPTLVPGEHTVTVKARGRHVPGAVPGSETTKTWSFTVADLPPEPTTETLSATKDALVYEKNPHSNEGANPRLTLEKINGKAARNLLGFNLAGLNTTSLTSATLVLSIDPSDQVTGWGNGETVTVKPVTVGWQEGNGKKHGLPGSQQTAGSGAGTTWFSPTDDNISNGSANAVVQWSGAATYATTGTAPAHTVHNNQTGELRFDVTDDVLNGVTHGWLLRKDAENKGSKVSFYSREGGGANLGPRLILEYNGPTAMSAPDTIYTAIAGFFGFKSRPVSLQASAGVSEGRKGLKEFLRGSSRSAFVGEQVVLGFVGRHPLTQLGARVVYRSWLRETPSLV